MSDLIRAVVVTGANRGIGLEIVRLLTREGYRVAACVRSESEPLTETLAEGKGAHAMFAIDLSDEKSIAEAARNVLAWNRHPIGLVNCAGKAHGSLYSMTTPRALRDLFNVNFFGPIAFTQLIARTMQKNCEGSIINVASTAGILADAGNLAYGSAKAALIHASRIMAAELGPFGVRVNAIAPSVVETDMATEMNVESRAKLDNRSALEGRIDPIDVANLVNFLLSPLSSKISGQVIRIDRSLPF